MSNPFTDYIQDLYWMYVSAGYSEESAILLAEAEAAKEAATYYDPEE